MQFLKIFNRPQILRQMMKIDFHTEIHKNNNKMSFKKLKKHCYFYQTLLQMNMKRFRRLKMANLALLSNQVVETSKICRYTHLAIIKKTLNQILAVKAILTTLVKTKFMSKMTMILTMILEVKATTLRTMSMQQIVLIELASLLSIMSLE